MPILFCIWLATLCLAPGEELEHAHSHCRDIPVIKEQLAATCRNTISGRYELQQSWLCLAQTELVLLVVRKPHLIWICLVV